MKLETKQLKNLSTLHSNKAIKKKKRIKEKKLNEALKRHYPDVLTYP